MRTNNNKIGIGDNITNVNFQEIRNNATTPPKTWIKNFKKFAKVVVAAIWIID